MHDRPKARTEQLISERIDDELVIYDQLNHVAHCLSHDAVLVWEHCDGLLTETEIAHRLTLSLEVVDRAVAALDERGLLDEGPAAASGYSRRQAAIRMARIGSAVLAGPLCVLGQRWNRRGKGVASRRGLHPHLVRIVHETGELFIPLRGRRRRHRVDELDVRLRPLLLQSREFQRRLFRTICPMRNRVDLSRRRECELRELGQRAMRLYVERQLLW